MRQHGVPGILAEIKRASIFQGRNIGSYPSGTKSMLKRITTVAHQPDPIRGDTATLGFTGIRGQGSQVYSARACLR